MESIDKLHTTELGVLRIKNNLGLDTDDVIGWCREKILSETALISRKGKNLYIEDGSCIITVNAYSYTVITAHQRK